MTTEIPTPHLDQLGRDLLDVPWWARIASLALPFALATGFFVFATAGWWIPALACAMLINFFTYGSVSHDLVHRTLRLPPAVNEILLCAIELLTLRSGHAYRAAHLHHHARFPHEDDIEAAAARMPLVAAIADGLTLQWRIWFWALQRAITSQRRQDIPWIAAEGALIFALLALAIAVLPVTPLPAVFLVLMIAGSWVFPLVTTVLPHDPRGTTPLTQTRLFRGKILGLLALEHLYHLEHHLYPQVPHHNWPELARRLDPHLRAAGIQPIKLLF
jgi:beta-carotene hydroxylase